MGDYIKPRDIVNTVSIFTGDEHGVKFRNFAIACEDAKLSQPAEAESALAQLLKTRLGGIALPLTQGTHFETVQALLTHLKKIFAPRDSTLSLRGELGKIHQLYNEPVPSYLSRTRALGNNIVESYKTEHNNVITALEKAEPEREVTQDFLLGLRSEIANQIDDFTTLNEAGLAAIKIESKLQARAQVHLGEQITSNTKAKVEPAIPKKLTEKEPEKTYNHSQQPFYSSPERSSNYYRGTERATPVCNFCQKKGHTYKNCRR